jgi:hypothetical protein
MRLSSQDGGETKNVKAISDHCMAAAMNASPQSTSDAQVSSPGVALSKQTAALLRRQRFVAVLGSETIDSWEVDWHLLENVHISFSHTRKASLISHLRTRMKANSQMPNQSDDFERLYTDLLKLRDKISGLHEERLKRCALEYFAHFFRGAPTVKFSPKLAGVQMGSQAHVTFPDGKSLKYHLKTHSGGRLTSHSSAAKPIDPRELLVYKFLEHLGVGCESHFFHRSLEDVFIATLDAGHAEGSSFSTFQRATCNAKCDGPDYGDSLWGSLRSELDRHKDMRVIEDNIQSDCKAQHFLLQMASLDMICRIFRLHDLLNNSDNFGFCTSPKGMRCLKVLDFRLPDSTDMSLGQEHFRGFLVGNGTFNYRRSHITLRYAFRDRPRMERVQTALHLLTTGFLCNSRDCIQSAYEDVRLCFESFSSPGCDVGEVQNILVELEEFCQILRCNVDFFISALESFVSSSVPGSLP